MAGKPLSQLNIAIINEAAAVESGDKTWLFDEFAKLRKFVGGEIYFVNLLALDIETIEKRLEFADVIYVAGGNYGYLMTVFRKTGFDKLLRDKLLAKKIYVGSSAGSMIAGRLIESPDYLNEFVTDAKIYGVDEYMNLVDFAIIPHMNNGSARKNAAVIRKSLTENPFPVYGVSDSQAVIMNNSDISFVGGEIVKFGEN